jgi:hypothetical protein
LSKSLKCEKNDIVFRLDETSGGAMVGAQLAGSPHQQLYTVTEGIEAGVWLQQPTANRWIQNYQT